MLEHKRYSALRRITLVVVTVVALLVGVLFDGHQGQDGASKRARETKLQPREKGKSSAVVEFWSYDETRYRQSEKRTAIEKQLGYYTAADTALVALRMKLPESLSVASHFRLLNLKASDSTGRKLSATISSEFGEIEDDETCDEEHVALPLEFELPSRSATSVSVAGEFRLLGRSDEVSKTVSAERVLKKNKFFDESDVELTFKAGSTKNMIHFNVKGERRKLKSILVHSEQGEEKGRVDVPINLSKSSKLAMTLNKPLEKTDSFAVKYFRSLDLEDVSFELSKVKLP